MSPNKRNFKISCVRELNFSLSMSFTLDAGSQALSVLLNALITNAVDCYSRAHLHIAPKK